MPPSRLAPAAAALCATAAAICLTRPAAAQAAAAPAAASATPPEVAAASLGRTVVGGEWLQLGAGGVHRHAAVSMGATLGHDLTPGHAAGLRLELGWQRAARVTSTAQGVTAGLSVPVVVPGTAARLTVRPGIAGLAGWTESQGGRAVYDWRGLPGTPYNGLTGTQGTDAVVRSRATGVGGIVGAELQLARGVAVTASVRRWAFSGSAIQSNRNATLAGFGLAFRPAGRRRAAEHVLAAAPGVVAPIAKVEAAPTSVAAATVRPVSRARP